MSLSLAWGGGKSSPCSLTISHGSYPPGHTHIQRIGQYYELPSLMLDIKLPAEFKDCLKER